MAEDPKTERVQLMMTPAEVKAVDDWSFANRVRGRSEAIRRLVEAALPSGPTAETNAELEQMLRLAGVTKDASTTSNVTKLEILLPEGTPIEDMRRFIAIVKSGLGFTGKMNELTINGERYVATGVERDL